MEGEGGTFILAFLRLHTHTRKHSPSSLTCNVSLPYWTDLILSSFFFLLSSSSVVFCRCLLVT